MANCVACFMSYVAKKIVYYNGNLGAGIGTIFICPRCLDFHAMKILFIQSHCSQNIASTIDLKLAQISHLL